MIARVALVGLSGTGKSAAARLIAEALGWTVVDTDDEVESWAGASIPMIFRDQGEAAFRTLERVAMREALSQSSVVIATGGGAVLDQEIWTERWLGAPETLVVRFDADPRELLERLRRQVLSGARNVDRPLLAGTDPLTRLELMRRDRERAYAQADVTLDVSTRPLADTVADVIELVHLGSGQASIVELALPHVSSLITVGPGTRSTLGGCIVERWPAANRLWIGVDEHVAPHVTDLIDAEPLRERFDVRTTVIPSGESSKRLAGLSALYDWMLDGGVRREDVAVALGGGMVGDLMGYAAATVLRGIGLVQVPTTLLSMVDSGIGGKTGINHPAGKNLIGAFYQPSRVLVDPDLLRSLPGRELRSGWAEIIKHAVVEPATPGGEDGRLLTTLERNASALQERRNPLLTWVIRQNIAIKTAVVEADERESHARAVLNFGHTIGHAIEAADYQLLHGESVAVGMRAALLIAERMNLIDSARVERITSLIAAFGLPTSASAERKTVRDRMMSDKKIAEGHQTWILPVQDGGVIMSREVPDAAVEAALGSVLTGN